MFVRSSILLLMVIVFLAAVAESAVITVNADGTGDYATIQDAIDNASGGYEVVLQPGNYTGDGNRDISFRGKAITVRSSDPDNWTIVEATIIDCQGSETDPHRGFSFHDNETAASVLAGLTITNGYAPYQDYPPSRYGGTAEASVPPHDWANIADINNDLIVNWGDFSIFANYWLAQGECIPADLNRNQIVDWSDFSIFTAHWLECTVPECD